MTRFIVSAVAMLSVVAPWFLGEGPQARAAVARAGATPRTGESRPRKPAAQPAAPRPAAARPAVRKPAQANAATAKKAAAQPKLVTLHTKFDVQAAETVTVRLFQPPPKFDEKGNIQKYTRADLKKLKGDHPELPGYPGEFGDLKNGQMVVAYFGRASADAASTSSLATKDKPEAGANTTPKSANDVADSSPSSAGKPATASKPAKARMPTLAGILAGTVSNLDESGKKFTLTVDTQHNAANVPKIDSKEMLKDYHITMILIVKE